MFKCAFVGMIIAWRVITIIPIAIAGAVVGAIFVSIRAVDDTVRDVREAIEG